MPVNNVNKVISKYHFNEKLSLDSCFENERYKYLNLDGSYNVVEVPLDQFNMISYDMKEMIKDGKIYGIFNSLLASQMFKPSMFTYEQVKNIALMGWIDGLKVDVEKEELIFDTDIGLSPLIACALKKLDKDFFVSSDLKLVYEKSDEFFKDEKIMKGFLFKKEVELIDDLKEVDKKCQKALKDIAYKYLLTSSEIQDLAHDLKSQKYVDFLKKIIDDKDVYQSAYDKIEAMAKDVLEDRKVFKLKSLYKEVLKTFKIDEKHEVSGAKTEISSEPLALNFFKMVFAMVALSIGLLSFFQANYFENKLKSVDTYTLNVLSVNNEKFDNLFNLVNESVSSSVVQSIFEKISSAIIFTKMSFSLSQFILDFGKNWFFMPLLPLFFTFLSLYFAFGMKNKISRKFYGVARIFFVFAFLLRFFVPLNSYVLAKTDEYALNTVYEQGYKSFKSYVENDKKSDKKAKQQSESLEKQTIKTSGDMLAILYLKSLILPLLILLTFKRFLSFK